MTESPSITMKLTPHLLMEQIHLHGWNWMSAGAAFGLCFGILSPLAGSVITAITWFTGPHWHGFFIQRDGTVLLFLNHSTSHLRRTLSRFAGRKRQSGKAPAFQHQ